MLLPKNCRGQPAEAVLLFALGAFVERLVLRSNAKAVVKSFWLAFSLCAFLPAEQPAEQSRENRAAHRHGLAVAATASGLGAAAAAAVQCLPQRVPAVTLLLCLGHLAEFCFNCRFHQCTWYGFLLRNVPLYNWLWVLSTLENDVWRGGSGFWLGQPPVDGQWPAGQLLFMLSAIGGLLLRGWAWAAAGADFNHEIQTTTEATRLRKLCKSGPYAFCRHPGYAGWMLSAVSMQLMMGNIFFSAGLRSSICGGCSRRNMPSTLERSRQASLDSKSDCGGTCPSSCEVMLLARGRQNLGHCWRIF